MKDFITFIIPTIGRKTLLNSIQSLNNQTNDNWRAIIIFDGVQNNFEIENVNEKIKIFEIEKRGISINQASEVRNYGIRKAESKWIAFLDDDDTLSKDYVEIFYNEQKNFNFDVYIFRMKMDNRIIPNQNEKNIKICDIGISFIIKKYIFDNISFENSGTEDYDFLKKVENNNHKIIISNYVSYFVKGIESDTIKLDNNKKIFINGFNPYLFLGLNYYLCNKFNS
tara:strand:- start:511 stop:1185 length:675 start_codon:yes stop_codon:yes gene_type:complete